MKSRTCWPRSSNSSSPGAWSEFLRHARIEGRMLWVSSRTRSRKLGAPQSCRTLVGPRSVPLRAALCGLKDFVSSIRSEFRDAFILFVWLGRREFMVQAATVCMVSDSVLQSLLKDPRVLTIPKKCGKMHPKSSSGWRCYALARRRDRGRSR